MRTSGQIWRQRTWVWVPALLFFIANLAVLSTYRIRYAGQAQSLNDRLKDQVTRLAELDQQRQERQAMITTLQLNDAAVRQLYDERFSTRKRRLVDFTREVQAMATKAGLRPLTMAYPEETIESFDLIRRSFDFTVDGTYADLRRFVQELELSRSFITLDAISVSGQADAGSELQLELHLSTYFARDPNDPVQSTGSSSRGTKP
jgi:Tfp pilus assembly protein PilO